METFSMLSSMRTILRVCELCIPVSLLRCAMLIPSRYSINSAASQRHLPSVERQTRSHQTAPPPHQTFQLCEFNNLFGADAHYFLFIQRESNSTSLTNLQQNLRHASSTGEARLHPRIFTEDDLANIQTSCMEILSGLSFGSDIVGFYVVTGRIHVGFHPSDSVRGERGWFEKVFSCSKFPEWGALAGKMVDLEKEVYKPHEDLT